MPPKPVITRWGTWIDAVSFYCENFEAVVDCLNPKDASCISESQKCFTQDVWQAMAYIQSNFGTISQSITKLEAHGLTIQESMEIFVSVRNQMDFASGL
uniref:Pentatricopeptide repeat-containing protein n=1 Tax=Meloidogyne hapla TaxID=6305 RepID=A0A1I8BPI4_MELHA